jgi:hypothetical protein
MSDKKSLDLDFSEIQGEKQSTKGPVAALANKDEQKDEPTRESKPSGIVLCIKRGKNFLAKDMLQCTPEEFLEWAKGVYPHVDQPPEMFKSKKARIQAFKQIQQYHMSCMTAEERKAKN